MSTLQDIVTFVQTYGSEPRPPSPPDGYVWIEDEKPSTVIGHDNIKLTRWPVALLVDVVVVGGGPIGLSTAHTCGKEGKKVIVLEKSVLYNASGSSADFVRMFRTMYTEDYMADLAKETIGHWDALERESGDRLIQRSGLLNFGNKDFKNGPEGNLMAPIKNLDRLKMPYQKLSASEIMDEYPFKNLPENYIGLFAADNGVINVPQLLRTLVRLCLLKEVKIFENAGVKIIRTDDSGVRIKATDMDSGEHRWIYAKKCALTCGAFINDILGPSFGFELDLDIWEMVYEYYSVKAETYFKSMWFQFENPDDTSDPRTSNLYYGFPAVPWGPANCARIAVDNAVRKIKDPSERTVGPARYDLERTREWCMKHIPGLDPTPAYSGACLQTNVYDNMYVLDYLPTSVGEGRKNVVVFTAGWAMKMVPLIGIMLKDLLLHPEREPTPVHKEGLKNFRIERTGQNGESVIRIPPIQHGICDTTRSLRALISLRARYQLSKVRPGSLSIPAPLVGPVATKTDVPLNIGIIGAGMAGLYSMMILQSLGIQCEILEAAVNPGGRVRSHYFSSKKWDYIDLGAMRIPKIGIMDRVIGTDEWSLINKVSTPIKLGKYIFSADNTITMYNGIRVVGDVNWAEDPFGFSKSKGGNVPDEYVKKGPSQLLEDVIKPYTEVLMRNFQDGFANLQKLDNQSMRDVLLETYDPKVVAFIETAGSNVTGYFEKAASEIVIDNLDFGGEEEWVLFEGGATTLTDAMIATITDKSDVIKYRHQVRRLAPCGDQFVEISGVVESDATADEPKEPFSKNFTHVISTVTNHAFRLIDTEECNLRLEKRAAIRSLRYDNSTKVALKFEKRFWQQGTNPISGGASNTDMPIRQVVYPSYGCEEDTGVIIVSYTWALDAEWMGNLSIHDENRALEICLSNLARLHNIDLTQLKGMYKGHKFMNWSAEKYAQGAFAMFSPGQFTNLFDPLIKPEMGERLFFAGEHASLHHAWIVGSLNSAYRCVDQIFAREEMVEYREKLRDQWGICQESDSQTGGLGNSYQEDSMLLVAPSANSVTSEGKNKVMETVEKLKEDNNEKDRSNKKIQDLMKSNDLNSGGNNNSTLKPFRKSRKRIALITGKRGYFSGKLTSASEMTN